MVGIGEALAAPGPGVHARRPAYDKASLDLVGAGVYRGAPKRAQLKLTVCLRKRIGRRFFDVRCATGEGSGPKLKVEATVPGCVAGVWRTTASGEAVRRNGSPLASSNAVSRPFRCRRPTSA